LIIFARAGKKEGGWGEGIFARPRFSAAAAEFRSSETGAPLKNFVQIIFLKDTKNYLIL